MGNHSQIMPMEIVELYWHVGDRNGEGGWSVENEVKRIYYRDPVSTKMGSLDSNFSFEIINYEVIKEFKNHNYIQAAIAMKFGIVNFGETAESENYKCLHICAKSLQEYINLITKGSDYLHVDASINSDTKFDKVPEEKTGKTRLN